MNERRSEARRGAALTIALLALSAGLGGVMVGSSGCTGGQCVGTGGSEVPSTALECGSGRVCYLGGCYKSCNAGAENADVCESDGDCSEAARPTCVSGRCSACAEGEYCVPQLNICGTLTPPTFDGGIDGGPPLLAQDPLPPDGGFAVPRFEPRDAGNASVSIETSHEASLTVARIDNLQLNGQSTFAAMQVFFLTTSTVTGDRELESEADTNNTCVIKTARRLLPGEPANIGRVVVSGSGAQAGVTPNLTLTADTMTQRYGALVNNFTLNLSRQSPANTVKINGSGDGRIVNKAYPDPAFAISHAIPFVLEPDAATRTLFTQGIRIQGTPSAGLTFRWTRPPVCTPEITPERCLATGAALVVTIVPERQDFPFVPGFQAYATNDPTEIPLIECKANGEYGQMNVSEGLLGRYLDRAGPGRFLVFFERRYTTQVPVTSNLAQRTATDFFLTLSHGLVTSLDHSR